MNLNSKKTIITVIIFFSLITAIGFWLFPWISDDLNYRSRFTDYFLNDGNIALEKIKELYIRQYTQDNGRLANFTMGLIQFSPDWLLGLLSGFSVAVTLIFSLKIIGKEDSFTSLVLMLFCFFIVMPWVDQMYVFDFQLNYLFGGMFMLLFLYSFLYSQSSVWYYITALIVGVWQEAFGFPVFIAMCGMMLFFKKYRTRSNLIALAIIVAGLAHLYLCPGGQSYRGTDWRPFDTRIGILLVFAVPSAIFIISAIIYLLRNKFKICTDSIHILTCLILIIIPSTFLLIYSQFGPRVGWASVLMSCIGGIYLLPLFNIHIRKPFVYSGCAALFIFTLIHLIAVDYYCYINKREYDRTISLYRDNPSSEIFVDTPTRAQAPWICLQKPYFGIFNHHTTLILLSAFYSPGSPIMKTTPRMLENYRMSEAQTLQGNAGLTDYKGLIVGDNISDEVEYIEFIAVQGSEESIQGFCAIPFTDADGIARTCYLPNASFIREIIGIPYISISYVQSI